VRQLLFENKFSFFVIILLFFAGCEKKNNTIVDSVGYAPVLIDASFSNPIVNTDTINIAGQQVRSPDDTLTIRGIAKVRVDSSVNGMNISFVGYSVTNYNFSSSLTEGTLHDDGVFPDAKANDGIFSGYVEFQIQRTFVGTFSINIWSEGTTGYMSNTFILPLQIVRLNRPPVLSNLQAPDTIVLAGQMQQLLLTVKATDPDGESDITKVYFNSFKPNGAAASGNPFLMYDDGSENIIYPPNITSGDAVKGDNVYSLTVIINPTDALGTYRFEFHAVDRSNDTSNVIIKNIVVTN
jgi:hypothetical protein